MVDIEEERGGKHLDEQIAQARQAIAIALLEGREAAPPSLYTALSGLLYDRFQQDGLASDIHEARTVDELALSLTPANDPEMPERKCALAVDLEALSRFTGDMGLLDQAIELIVQSIEETPEGPENRTDWRERKYNLAVYKSGRYKTCGDMGALWESRDIVKEVIDDYVTQGEEGEVDTDALHMQAEVHHDLFLATGDIALLEEAVDLYAVCLSRESNQDFRRSRVEDARARSLHDLYVVTGEWSHLVEAVSHMRNAIGFTSPDSVLMPDYQSDLGGMLGSQYRHTKDVELLKETVKLERESLAGTSAGHQKYSLRLAALGYSLLLLYEAKEEDDSLLEESIRAQLRAVQEALGHPWLFWWQTKLSETYLVRFVKNKDREDLDNAVHYAELACGGCTPDTPDFAPAQLAYARALIQSERASAEEGGGDMGDNISSRLREAYEASTAPNIKVECAVECAWYEEDREHFSEALASYSNALDLLPQLFWLGLEVADRAVLSTKLRLASLPSDAAACALQLGDTQAALEILERGRSLLWAQSLSLQTDISELKALHPEEAAKFQLFSEKLRTRISVGNTRNTSQQGMRLDAGAPSSHDPSLSAHRLMSDWTALVSTIQSFPGFSQFLKPSTFDSIKQASKDGPVVIFTSSLLRNDALVLSVEGEVSAFRLPILDYEELEMMAWDAFQGRGKDRPLFRGAPKPQDESTGSSTSRSAINWLWDNVIAHLIDHLRRAVLPNNRVWLCPTGLFSFLPIHAARPSDPIPAGFNDQFIISYTSTLSALRRTHQRKQTAPSAPFRLLLVGQSHSTEDGYSDLETVSDELSRIKLQASAASTVTLLQDGDATVSRVVESMAGHSWVHFACHAHQDLDPMQSSLHLSDGLLRMRELMGMVMPNSQFAFLSACETAAGDRRMPDEAIHLAAGLQFAGFTSIISTLWLVDDKTAPLIAEAVYKYLLDDQKGEGPGVPQPQNAARALSNAIQRCRADGISQARLIPFVHIGV